MWMLTFLDTAGNLVTGWVQDGTANPYPVTQNQDGTGTHWTVGLNADGAWQAQ